MSSIDIVRVKSWTWRWHGESQKSWKRGKEGPKSFSTRTFAAVPSTSSSILHLDSKRVQKVDGDHHLTISLSAPLFLGSGRVFHAFSFTLAHNKREVRSTDDESWKGYPWTCTPSKIRDFSPRSVPLDHHLKVKYKQAVSKQQQHLASICPSKNEERERRGRELHTRRMCQWTESFHPFFRKFVSRGYPFLLFTLSILSYNSYFRTRETPFPFSWTNKEVKVRRFLPTDRHALSGHFLLLKEAGEEIDRKRKEEGS